MKKKELFFRIAWREFSLFYPPSIAMSRVGGDGGGCGGSSVADSATHIWKYLLMVCHVVINLLISCLTGSRLI